MTCRNCFNYCFVFFNLSSKQNRIKCTLNFLNSNFKWKRIVKDSLVGRIFVFKCLIIYINFFICVYEVWYFYVPLYGSCIIMMGYTCITCTYIRGNINTVGFIYLHVYCWRKKLFYICCWNKIYSKYFLASFNYNLCDVLSVIVVVGFYFQGTWHVGIWQTILSIS